MPKLYRDEGRWVVPGKQGRKAERVDIPSQAEALAEWLNQREQDHDQAFANAWRSREQLEAHPQLAAAAAAAAVTRPVPDADASKAIQRGTDAVAEWIMDHATQAQVEHLFAALGCRWGEARKQA